MDWANGQPPGKANSSSYLSTYVPAHVLGVHTTSDAAEDWPSSNHPEILSITRTHWSHRWGRNQQTIPDSFAFWFVFLRCYWIGHLVNVTCRLWCQILHSVDLKEGKLSTCSHLRNHVIKLLSLHWLQCFMLLCQKWKAVQICSLCPTVKGPAPETGLNLD